MGWLGNLFRKSKHPELSDQHDISEQADLILQPYRIEGTGRDSQNLPRFQVNATDHAPGHGLGDVRLALRSAFTPSQPVRSYDMLAGRISVLKTLIRSLEDQQLHVVLYGDRGIGKTSLLHVLAGLARDARYIVRYSSCGEETEFTSLFRSILADIPLLYYADYSPTSEETEQGGSLADLLPAGNFTIPQLTDILAKISNTRVIIILDEFDRAHSASFRRSVAELIKNLSDRSVRVQMVIAGVAANLTELVEHIPSIRRNVLGFQVPSMTRDEVKELIANGERKTGMQFDKAVVARITDVASGSPYIASLLGQHAGFAALDRGATTVSEEDVRSAVYNACEEVGSRISAGGLYAIRKARADGRGEALGELAHLALQAGGRLNVEQVGAVLNKSEDTAQFLNMMEDRYGLIELIPGDPLLSYQFREEGLPAYLWLEKACGQETASASA